MPAIGFFQNMRVYQSIGVGGGGVVKGSPEKGLNHHEDEKKSLSW